MSAAKRMSKEERRQQLLETASDIVRAEGTGALTLGYLAERAGVTKPIAYEHFGTRAGLLIALYQELDERQNRVMRAALKANGKTLEDVARIVSAAYVDCALTLGPEFGALSATEEMEDFRRSVRDSCILEGLLGAAESLSQAAASGRTSRAQAVLALSRIMQGALE